MKKLAPIVLAAVAIVPSVLAQDSHYSPARQQIPHPACIEFQGVLPEGHSLCTDATHPQWLADITHWRNEHRIRIGYDDARYGMPALKWAQSAFIQPQMMVQDRYFYDPVAHHYTVNR